MSSERPPRPPSVLRMLLGALLLGAVFGAGLGVARALLGPSPWILAGGLALAMLAAAALFAPAWSRVDEAVRTAHQWAWFWGGSAGLMVAVALMPLVRAGTVDLSAGGSPEEAAVNAMAALVLLQLVGYGVAWAIWWLRRR